MRPPIKKLVIKPYADPDWDGLPVVEVKLGSVSSDDTGQSVAVTLLPSWPAVSKLDPQQSNIWNLCISQLKKVAESTKKDDLLSDRIRCQVSGTAYRQLYFFNGAWISKACYRSADSRDAIKRNYYRAQISVVLRRRKRFSRPERDEIVGHLRRWGPGEDQALEEFLAKSVALEAAEADRLVRKAKAERRRRTAEVERRRVSANAVRQSRRHADADPAGTDGALRAGRRALRAGTFAQNGLQVEQLRLEGPLEPARGPLARLEDHARLDLRHLVRKGALEPHRRSPFAFRWSAASGPGDLYFQFRCDAAEAWVELRYALGGRTVVQIIRLQLQSVGGRLRPWFLCPVSSKPCEVLAFREGRFASVRAQRLDYGSQMGARRRKRS